MKNNPKTNELCDICNAHESLQPYLMVSLAGVFDAQIWECERCGFRQVRPRVTLEELRALYSRDYFDPAADIGFKDYARQQQRYEREGYFLAKKLRRVARTGRLLEVGFGLGFLLESLKRHTSWEVEGIDVAQFGIWFARRKYGLNVKCMTLEEANYPSNTFDFVIQKDLLEHVLRPREHLIETCRIMRPGGLLWLTTPNGKANLKPLRDLADSLSSSADALLPLLDQGHLSFFLRDNLLKLVSECGFKCLRFRNIGIKRGLRSLGLLPRKRTQRRTAPKGKPCGAMSVKTSPSIQNNKGYGKLYERFETEIERCHKPPQSWLPYYYYRHFLKSFSFLPSPFTLGNDFDLILKK